MKKKTFALIVSLLALCAILNTAAFAVTEAQWFARPTESAIVLVQNVRDRA